MNTDRIRVSLRRKFTLAFVTVILIGFVVAFAILPRLYVWSQNREIDLANPHNVNKLRQFLEAQVMASGLMESLVQPSLQRLFELSDFDMTGIEVPHEALRPQDIVRLVESQKGGTLLRDLRQELGLLQSEFEMVRFLPWKAGGLTERICVVPDEEGEGYFLPFVIPLEYADKGIEGTLVLACHYRQPLPMPTSGLYENLATAGLRSASDVLFFSSTELQQFNLRLWEEARKHHQVSFFEMRAETDNPNQRNLYIPVINLLDPEEEPVGFFRIIYAPTIGLFAWKELLSGISFVALAIAGLFAALFSYFFAKSITRPIQDLTEGALAIANGQLDREVEISSHDEIGLLARTFNDMTARLRTTLAELRDRAETIQKQNIELDRRFNQLNELQTYTENILRTVGNAIFSVDLEGNIRRFNRAAQDLVGLRDGMPMDEIPCEPLKERLYAALDTGEATSSEEIQFSTGPENRLSMALSVTPLKEGEHISGAVAVLTDLQTIKTLEALVRRQERLAALGQLSAGVAHEIRNPLSIIKACAEILQANFEGQSGENGLCRDIIEEVDRLSRVVSDFLTFARPKEPDCQPIQLNDLVQKTLELAERGYEKNVKLEFAADENLPIIEADSDQLEQVLLNLIRNGIEAMGQGGVLRVSSHYFPEQKVICLDVQDEGMGMSEDVLRRIFDPFYTSKDKGTGLGLSICHRIMESHGGKIEVIDTQPGKGTTFRITLPVSGDNLSPAIQNGDHNE